MPHALLAATRESLGSLFTFRAQRQLDLPQRQTIHHVVFNEPPFTRDANTEPQVLQSLPAMRVRIDNALDAFRFCQRPPSPVEIESFRRGVELDPCSRRSRR